MYVYIQIYTYDNIYKYFIIFEISFSHFPLFSVLRTSETSSGLGLS